MKNDTRLGGGLAAAVAVAVVACALGCDNSSSPAPKPSGEGGTTTPPTPAWRAAVGAGGTLVQTFDDRAWATRVVPLAAGIDLLGVTCVGNADGWAVGQRGAVAHTTDGGFVWTLQDAHTSATLRAIHFGDAQHGLLAGDDGVLAVTRDGGATWLTVATGAHAALRGVAIAGSTLLAVGDGGTVLRSVDGGASFALLHVDGAGDLHGVAMDPGAHLVLAVDTLGGAWASTDRGATFVREMRGVAALHAVSLRDDGAAAIAVGSGGVVQVRDAHGRWTAAASGTSAELHAALVEDGAAYAAGDDGTLLVSHDVSHPEQWERIDTGTRAALFALDDL